MAPAQGIGAGRAFVELFADDSELVQRGRAHQGCWPAGLPRTSAKNCRNAGL